MMNNPRPALGWAVQIWCCGTVALREFLSPLPAQLGVPSEPQALAVGLRRIVVPAHG
ncbi:hypothetical protein Pla52n_15970 [Stieleria varia]|uniref:Uncharacterized protein n=1 Tax=Stieleria varia TaxID=2528005 RepID=A0A5C6B306_9BACT|nr:hypothetical protein Pla52n_15970 [Stieleria varia]